MIFYASRKMVTVVWTALSLLLIGSLGAGAQTAAPSNTPSAAFAAFTAAFASVNDYTDSISTHETLGTQSQDRSYDFKWKRPSYAWILVTEGSDVGSGASWSGGTTLKAHQGGFISGYKIDIPYNDPRAVSLRGDTIDVASFAWEIKHYTTVPGKMSDAAGPMLGGGATTAMTFTPTTPAHGVTKEILYISNATHLPVRREQYSLATIVKWENFKNVKTNVGLTTADFD